MLQRDQDLLILQIDTHRYKCDNAASNTFRILLQVQTHDLGCRTEINHVFHESYLFQNPPFPFSISYIFFYLQAARDLTPQCQSRYPVRTSKIVIDSNLTSLYLYVTLIDMSLKSLVFKVIRLYLHLLSSVLRRVHSVRLGINVSLINSLFIFYRED